MSADREAAVLRARVYRLYPTPAQAERMSSWVGAVRYAYNIALDQRIMFWRPGRRFNFATQGRELADLRAEADWLQDVPRTCLEQGLIDLDRAYQNWWAGRARAPHHRRKGVNDSFRVAKTVEFSLRRSSRGSGRLKLLKLGAVRFKWEAPPAGEARSVTVFRRAGHWFAAVQYRLSARAEIPVESLPIGIDLGVKVFAALSNGELVAPVGAGASVRGSLARAQRKLARKKKGSSNYRKQRLRVSRLRLRAANTRKDFLHKLSTRLANSHSIVVVEDLRVRNMVRSAAGTTEEPGKNVRQKSGLNRSIMDQGWGEFRRQLQYKLDERGGLLIAVPANDTSRTCTECGVVDAASRKAQRFVCTACGHEAHADINAAINILSRAGSSVLPAEVSQSSGPVETGTQRRSA